MGIIAMLHAAFFAIVLNSPHFMHQKLSTFYMKEHSLELKGKHLPAVTDHVVYNTTSWIQLNDELAATNLSTG